jgi:hypothetical protein
VIGQDPAQHETIVRRVLVGEAGKRLQGLLGKLGITTSYVIINTFLYSVYGSVKAATARDVNLIAYRNSWLDALLIGQKVEAVIALGTAADAAWRAWKQTSTGKTFNVAYTPVTHPTEPESSSKNDKKKLAAATKKLLENWNSGLQAISPSVKHPDLATALVPYGETWTPGDRPSIPEGDMPAGLPSWMHEQDGWAARLGTDAKAKRRNITIKVPTGIVS